MLKYRSILILLASLALCSCRTMEFADVAPEMRGCALGNVKIGRPNKDYFVIPGAPITPAQMRGDAPVPPQNIVVFKTRERQPLYRVAHVAGAPVRGVSRVYSLLVDTVARLAFGWWNKPSPAPAGGAPLIYPAAMLPEQTFARAPQPGAALPYAWASPQTHRNGG